MSEAESDESVADSIEEGTGRWPVERLKPLVEAMVFAAGDPLTTRRICDAVGGLTANEVRAAVQALQTEYAERGVRLVEVAGGWQFRTAAEHHSVVRQLFKDKPLRLTRAAIETIAINAYKQPATRVEIESVRGVDSAAVLETLVEKKVVKIAGRRDVPGRPLVYVTTPFFLEDFGLKDMKALPTLAELGDEIGNLAAVAEFGRDEEANAAVLPLEENETGVEEFQSAVGDAPLAEPQESGAVPKVRFRSAEDSDADVESDAADPETPSRDR